VAVLVMREKVVGAMSGQREAKAPSSRESS